MNEPSNITPPSDPALERLLDDALAPQRAPDGLADRILAATRDDVAQRFAEHQTDQPAVLARIGVHRARLAAAAVILLMQAGIWLTIIGITRDAHAITELDRDLYQLNQLAVADAPIDLELDLIADRIALTADVDSWSYAMSVINGDDSRSRHDVSGDVFAEPLLF